MEEGKGVTDKQTVHDTCASENRTSEAAGSVSSSQVSNPGPSEESAARFNRLKLFDKVMQKSLDKFIDHASFNRFSSVFRPLYKKNPQRMENIHKQFIEELQRAIQDDISRLIEEGRLEVKLNELDKLERAAKNNPEPAWRPSGVPEQDFCSFLMPYYIKQEAYMRLELKKIQVENAALAQKVQAGRESIAQAENRISAAVDEWKASVTEFDRLASCLCPADVFDV
ncbi:putative polyamine-modulated factor 1-like [Scophthalmus maximus]|uniref:Putative polyamine-modulated factor 1-like n=1 Tax=Scophthalmus maximus TaxID=52904 RepID=A0A2U9C673_SCOMX|nr:polyamine-modulated factor 1 isoform X2 [Scophthalmus maximus]AWP12057.1 putative polyamine-modulated factor 1-like [Scophthalmus maximus]